MSIYDRQTISEITGFDTGERFTYEEQVLVYFMRDNLLDCIDHWTPSDLADKCADMIPDQYFLDGMAQQVLARKWHCDFDAMTVLDWQNRIEDCGATICPRCEKVNDCALEDGYVEGPRPFHAECWQGLSDADQVRVFEAEELQKARR